VLATVSFKQKWAIPIETSGSAVVIVASIGEMRTPAWIAVADRYILPAAYLGRLSAERR